MSHLDPLITDLALILIIAGITTLVFKWLKQPVVLGYIVAGFLCSPHFVFTPNVTDTANINILANIGIIVLLFSLGLEFSLKKLVNVGSSAIITASVIVVGMMMLGYAAGRLLSFDYLDSLFLGAMLSMSSTTIIIKAFTDLNLRKQKFTSLVFGVLVVEDLFAVLSMVFLTSIAVKNKFEGKELLENVLKLSFFLIIWFLVGIYALPTFFKKVKRYLNDETLLIVAMGLCLGMVVFASAAGFSSALGAFIMGSILAGTVQAERIEKVIQPVKDLFGAVFFISVGMLVNPEILYEYALPILLLSVVVIVGQITLGTSGMLISGQPLKIAVQSGFSLAQVGEFAFIIATLGMSLNVIDSYLYPIIVAVSVITTFTTPYFIKLANPAYEKLNTVLPERFRMLLDNYTSNATTSHTRSAWKQILGLYLGKIIFYSTIIGGLMIISLSYFIPWVKNSFGSSWILHIAVLLSILVMSPFIWGLALKRIRNDQNSLIKKICDNYMKNHAAGNTVVTVKDQFDDVPAFDMEDNNTTIINRITMATVIPMIQNGVDLKRAEVCGKMTKISLSDIRYYISKILVPSEEKYIVRFVQAILFLFLYTDQKKEVDINSSYFLVWAAECFRRTNANDVNVVTIKQNLDRWAENTGVYERYRREASRVAYKKAIFFYFILMIQAYHLK